MNKDNGNFAKKADCPLRARHAKGALCAAFTAVAFAIPATSLGAGQASLAATPSGLKGLDPLTLSATVQHPREPETVAAFGAIARRKEIAPYANWLSMLERQEQGMQDAKDAKKYAAFLDQFEVYAHEPLRKMAQDVNTRVLGLISYKFKLYPNPDAYWAAPVQTVQAGMAECKAYAVLQYAIMRHLGVPENRLVMAFVNASGSDKGTSHLVLLMNVAKDGSKQDFVVLNDGGPVVDASLYARPQGANGIWSKPYVFFDALNQHAAWFTPLYDKVYGAKVSPKSKPDAPTSKKP